MRANGGGATQRGLELKLREAPRVRRGASEWLAIIAAQRASHLRVDEFCRRQGIARATFWYWRKRVRSSSDKSNSKAETTFLPVPIIASAPEGIEVDMGTVRLRLAGSAAARVVDAIIARIGAGG
jgi:transposase-like protein